MQIERLDVLAWKIPTDSPESDGTLKWDSTTIVVAVASAGDVQGIGYTYSDASTAQLVASKLREVVIGRDALAPRAAWHAMIAAVRNLGRPGIASHAISAVDVALWDLKARLLHISFRDLIGPVRDTVSVYGSGGFTSYSVEQLCRQLRGWVEQGITKVKMKVAREAEQDVRRVRAAREAIGNDAELFVDANGAYDRQQALAKADEFAACRVSWFEEPVSSDDLDGLRLIRDRAPAGMEITAGEYGYHSAYFRRMLECGAVDVLMADATRCGGVSGFLDADALCRSCSLPLSAHTAPSLHGHLGAVSASVRHVEYFHDHARIEPLLFEGALTAQEGVLQPDRGCPGLGLALKRQDLERFLVFCDTDTAA